MLTTQTLATYQRAAKLHAQAHRTDPFAYRRMMTHLVSGIEEAREVAKAALPFIRERVAP